MTVPPGKKYRGVVSILSASLSIPYNGTVYFNGTTLTEPVLGIWNGVSDYDLAYKVFDITG